VSCEGEELLIDWDGRGSGGGGGW